MSSNQWRVALSAVGLTVLGLVAPSCSTGSDDSASSSSSTTAPPTTAPSTTSESGTKTDPGGKTDESGVDPWSATAGPHRGDLGQEFDYSCPAGGVAGSLWGTNVYTDDSSVCTSAVQVGLITFDVGGDVTIEIVEGQDEYIGSEANGVTSADYGSWDGSFSLPEAEEIEVVAGIAWNRTAREFATPGETTFTVVCRPDGEIASLYGTDIYTDDSSVCTAALHAGFITLADGGEVTFEIVDGQESYEGSQANGVTSSDYGEWGSSFTFPSDLN